MYWYQRAGVSLVLEGFGGFWRRLVRKVGSIRKARQEAQEMAGAKETYFRRVDAFRVRAQALNQGDMQRFYWYHTIDLGNGLVTPGDYDYRDALPLYRFPEDMRGMRVLDVGSATGFFAFEFEKRGASVVSVDLPSVKDWDIVNTDRASELGALSTWHEADSQSEMDHRHLDGPFLFCHKVLNSKVKRCYSRIYDLTPKILGADQFDLIFLGDVLGHLFSPLQALDVLAPLCRGKMILSQDLNPTILGHEDMPFMKYIGGDSGDVRAWWIPNQPCLVQMLKRVGFKQVEVVGRHAPIVHRLWTRFPRCIIHAQKEAKSAALAA